MEDTIWVYFGLIFAGQLTWFIAAEVAKKWLAANDPYYDPPGAAARFFIGALFTSIGPVRRYAEQRRQLGQPATAATVFWAGLGTSILALILLLTSLSSL